MNRKELKRDVILEHERVLNCLIGKYEDTKGVFGFFRAMGNRQNNWSKIKAEALIMALNKPKSSKHKVAMVKSLLACVDSPMNIVRGLIQNNNIEAMETMIAAGFDLRTRDDEGNTIAHYIAACGGRRWIHWIDSENIEIDFHHEQPCNIRSSRHERLDHCDKLLVNDFGQTPVHIAIESHKPAMVSDLLADAENASVEHLILSHRDHSGLTPLLLACVLADTTSVSVLFEYEANVEDVVPHAPAFRAHDKSAAFVAGWTPLMFAAFHGDHALLAKVLSEKPNALVTADYYVPKGDEMVFKKEQTPISVASKPEIKLRLEEYFKEYTSGSRREFNFALQTVQHHKVHAPARQPTESAGRLKATIS